MLPQSENRSNPTILTRPTNATRSTSIPILIGGLAISVPDGPPAGSSDAGRSNGARAGRVLQGPDRPDLALVLPAYNEGGRIGRALEQLAEFSAESGVGL